MGIKGKIIKGSFLYAFEKGLKNSKGIKKVIALFLVLSLVCIAGMAGIAVYAVVKVSAAVTQRPDMDLLGLERLVSEKIMTVSTDQQAQMRPILEQLAEKGLPAEEKDRLKQQLLALLDEPQAALLDQWKREAGEKTRRLFTVPPAVVAAIEKYTGITPEMVKEKSAAFSEWWRTVMPGNSAEKLLGTMETGSTE